MKLTVLSLLLPVFLVAFVVGCDSGEPRTATDGADAQAIADYEAAVAAAEGNMATSEVTAGAEE